MQSALNYTKKLPLALSIMNTITNENQRIYMVNPRINVRQKIIPRHIDPN
jgi:hypothetical protein